jgi:hypothetical protein
MFVTDLQYSASPLPIYNPEARTETAAPAPTITTTTKKTFMQKLKEWIIAKPLQAAAIIALACAGLG